MSFGLGFALPAYSLRGGGGNNPFNQSGPTLDLTFAGVPTDPLGVTSLTDYTLSTDFIVPQYQIAAQYSIWEEGVGLASKAFGDIITFTRASTATYFDSAGVLQSAAIDVPRFDYNPATLAERGILIEEARTNILLYSAVGPAGTGWTAVGTSTRTYGQAAPDGSTDAVLFDDTDAAVISYMRQTSTVPNDTNTYCFSAFVKQGTTGKFFFRFAFTGGTATFGANIFDFATLTWSGGGAFISSGYQDAGNGWYRVWTTFPNNGTGNTTYDCRIGATSIAVTDTGSVYFWGIQTEVGAFPTSYIPTTTTALTRSADLALVNTVSPWFNATEGTLFAEAEWPVIAPSGTGVRIGAALSDGSTSNRVTLGRGGDVDNTRFFVTRAGVNQNGTNGQQIAGVFTSSNTAKLAYAYATDNMSAAANGTTAAATPPNALPIGINRLAIGSRYDTNTSFLANGWVRRVTYYPRRLSNAELVTVTA